MDDRLDELESIAANLLAIPANEQHLGHLQMAIRRSLLLIEAELRDLRVLCGERGSE